MPTNTETRVMPYSAEQMFDLIADIGKYPEFLPWTAGARIRKTTEIADGTVVEADLIISFKVFRERFTSRVTMRPDARTVDVEYLDGPFNYLVNNWKFTPHTQGCEVTFHVDFEFKSRVLQKLIGVVFNQAMKRIVGAFEKRAKHLYG